MQAHPSPEQMAQEKQKSSDGNHAVVIERVKQARMNEMLVFGISVNRHAQIGDWIGAYQASFAGPEDQACGMAIEFLANRNNFPQADAAQRFHRSKRALRPLRH